MSSARRLFLVAAAAALGILTVPSIASACSSAEGAHCHAITAWSMEHSGEEVRGAFDEIESFYGSVPNYTTDFIDNEMWVTFPSKAYSWVEAGATWGYGTPGPETPDYFYARSYSKTNYAEAIYPSGPPMYAWYGVYIDDPSLNGSWCVQWQWDTTPDICFTNFPKTSKELQSGLEYATTVSSGANNNGRAVGWAQWMDGSWHREWQGAYHHAEPFRNVPMCINTPAPGYLVGSIAFAAPGC